MLFASCCPFVLREFYEHLGHNHCFVLPTNELFIFIFGIRSKEVDIPEDLKNDPIIFPAQDLLSPLEFGAAVTLTDPNRAELMARFKSA